jgi:hypothetical protein
MSYCRSLQTVRKNTAASGNSGIAELRYEFPSPPAPFLPTLGEGARPLVPSPVLGES